MSNLKISIVTGIETENEIIVNTMDKIGSIISHYGLSTIINAPITTPTD